MKKPLPLIAAFVLLSAIAASLSVAHASSSIDLVESVNQLDEATLQDAALRAQDQLAKIPDELHAQGIEMTADQSKNLQDTLNGMSEDAKTSGFKKRVLAVLKIATKGSEKTGTSLLKVVGTTSDLAFGITFSPYLFGADFASSVLTGKAMYAPNFGILTGLESSFYVASTGNVVGFTGMFYLNIALTSIGYTAAWPLFIGYLGAFYVNAGVCNATDQNPKMKSYCAFNRKMMMSILGDSIDLGVDLGKPIHEAVAWTFRPFVRLFRHHKKSDQNPGSSTPSPPSAEAPVTPMRRSGTLQQWFTMLEIFQSASEKFNTRTDQNLKKLICQDTREIFLSDPSNQAIMIEIQRKLNGALIPLPQPGMTFSDWVDENTAEANLYLAGEMLDISQSKVPFAQFFELKTSDVFKDATVRESFISHLFDETSGIYPKKDFDLKALADLVRRDATAGSDAIIEETIQKIDPDCKWVKLSDSWLSN